MREKSQLEDMRAALQGDLERARERRGATLLDPEPEPQTDVSDTPDEAPEVIVQVSDTPEPAVEPEPELEPTPRRRFLWFLRD